VCWGCYTRQRGAFDNEEKEGDEGVGASLVRLGFCEPDEFLDLVFALSGDVVTAQDHLDIPPFRVLRNAFRDIVFEVGGQSGHERGAWA
jgi:hypothetical protein